MESSYSEITNFSPGCGQYSESAPPSILESNFPTNDWHILAIPPNNISLLGLLVKEGGGGQICISLFAFAGWGCPLADAHLDLQSSIGHASLVFAK